MKKLILLALAFSIYSTGFSQPEVIRESNGEKILKGFMQKQDVSNDSSFTWYARDQQNYTPDANALAALKAKKDSVYIVAFGGTWCDDSRSILPKFYSLAEAAGFSENRITLIGVDRDKKTVHHLTETFGVTNVPTLIVYKNGKELGRVVEYGKYGLYDKELGEILRKK
jgi:thiol-disulfide isomerase/thioredoxin